MTLPAFSYDSLVLMTIVNLLTTGSVMMFVWNADRPGPGLIQIAWGDLLMGLGFLIAALKTVIPGGSVALASNLAVFAGVMLIWTGVRAFRGLPPLRKRQLVAISTIYNIAFLYFVFVNNNPSARIFTVPVTFSLVTLFAAAAMFRDVPSLDRRLYYFSGTLLTFHAISLAVRALYVLGHPPASRILNGSPADFTALFSLNFVVTGCCLAIATASSRKLYHTTRKLALHDPLTSLPNRRMFEDRLQELGSVTAPCNVAVIYLDLDNFKAVNDSFGHTAGDRVLCMIGERMRQQFTGSGFAARLGGDEFVMLMEGPESRDAVHAAMNSVIRAIQSEIQMNDQTISIDVSGGMAMYPEDVPTLAELTDLADRYMYRAKARNRHFAGFTPAANRLA